MSADFKSHVLRRDEKGMFGIAFKRLLLAGVGGGLVYTLVRLALPEWSIIVGVLVALAFLVLTGQRGGLPLWQRGWYRLRGWLMVSASRHPSGMVTQVAQLLELPLTVLTLDAQQVFASSHSGYEVDMREWITFARASQDEGLVFVDAPMEVRS